MASAMNKYQALDFDMPGMSPPFRRDIHSASQPYLSLKQMGQAQMQAPEPDSQPEAIALGGMSDLLSSLSEALYTPKAPAPSPMSYGRRPSFSVFAPC